MLVKQVSIFLENKSGRLAEVTKVLSDSKINIRALSIADTTDFGILRIIVNDPEKALKELKNAGFTVSSTDVIAVCVADEPGGLSVALEILKEANIGIEYMYAFITPKQNNAMVILRVENCHEAIKILTQKGVSVISSKEIYTI